MLLALASHPISSLLSPFLQQTLTTMLSYNFDIADARIQCSIGSSFHGTTVALLHFAKGLAFDGANRLFVADSYNHRVQVFSPDTAQLLESFATTSGTSKSSIIVYPQCLAIDDDRQRLLVSNTYAHGVQALSLVDHTLVVSDTTPSGAPVLDFKYPYGVAIDRHLDRVIVADASNHRLRILAAADLSLLFDIGHHGPRPLEFKSPFGVAIDKQLRRVIVADSFNNRIQVLSAIDMTFLFEFGEYGSESGRFREPRAVCVDNASRIIVADTKNNRLQAFTSRGEFYARFDCGAAPQGVAFDECRGLIAFSVGHRVHVIAGHQWIPHTLLCWQPDLHRFAPHSVKQVVEIMTMIRSLVFESPVSLLPNELLFEIFSFL